MSTVTWCPAAVYDATGLLTGGVAMDEFFKLGYLVLCKVIKLHATPSHGRIIRKIV